MIKAVIFDMDGLMFDTERLAIEAWSHAGKKLGYDLKEELVYKTLGLDVKSTRRVFAECVGDGIDFEACMRLGGEYITQYVADNGMPLKKGLIELLNHLRSHQYRITMATSTVKVNAERYLRAANVIHYFDEIACGDMIKRGKPEPDIYLKAIEITGMAPEECMALEDAPAGILSAYRAGAKPVMIPDLTQPDEETSKLLYAKLPSLLEVIDLLDNENH